MGKVLLCHIQFKSSSWLDHENEVIVKLMTHQTLRQCRRDIAKKTMQWGYLSTQNVIS